MTAHLSKYFGLLLGLLLTAGLAQAQSPATTSLQVVTKTINDSYPYRPGVEINVLGEKAEIFVETSDAQEVYIRLEMISKHEDIVVARKDLENLYFLIEEEGQKIYMQNKRTDTSLRPESELFVNYYITVPEECPVYLKSHFGAANINNLRNRLRIDGEFSQININNVEGMLDIKTRFGDILGERIDGNVNINARRSDVELYDVGGSFTINSQFGELRIAPNASLRDLQISADQSDVYLFDPQGSPLSYNLTTTYGELVLPDEVPITELETSDGLRRVRIESGHEISGEIKVSVTFGNLILEKQEQQMRRRRRF